jgi:3-isopropylmalate dehydrogenase
MQSSGSASTPSRRVVVLAGDGIGPEITTAAVAVLETACAAEGIALALDERLVGGAAIEAEGAPVSDETVAVCRRADAVLLGAVGGPRWDHLNGENRPGFGLLRLRRDLDLFANIRPVRTHSALTGRTPLRDDVVRGTDLVIVRELTGGAYYGAHTRQGSGPAERATDLIDYTRAEVERVAHVAFALARARGQRLTSVDKCGVLWSGRLWRDVVTDVARDHPDVELEHQLVDSFAAHLIQSPRTVGVVLTENMFGDILSDEAAVLTGSLGLIASASIGHGGPGLYEPAHGSAPALAGLDAANPLAAILSVALLLEHSFGCPGGAARVRAAVDGVIDAGHLTPDLGGTASTAEVGAAVVAAMSPAVPSGAER